MLCHSWHTNYLQRITLFTWSRGMTAGATGRPWKLTSPTDRTFGMSKSPSPPPPTLYFAFLVEIVRLIAVRYFLLLWNHIMFCLSARSKDMLTCFLRIWDVYCYWASVRHLFYRVKYETNVHIFSQQFSIMHSRWINNNDDNNKNVCIFAFFYLLC